jgi:hypothetical protein
MNRQTNRENCLVMEGAEPSRPSAFSASPYRTAAQTGRREPGGALARTQSPRTILPVAGKSHRVVAAPVQQAPPVAARDQRANADGGILARFLVAWNVHQDLRRGDASVSQLWASRQQLDDLRLTLRSSPPG